MRVVIVGKYPLDSSRIEGGVQAAFSYLVGGLSRFSDLDLHVVTMASGGSQRYHRSEREGVTVHVLVPYPRLEFARNYRIYQARLDEALAHIQPDVLHAQDAAQDAYVALRSGFPTVITVHGIRREDGKYLTNHYLRLRNRIHSSRIENHNLRHTRHLIAISHYVIGYFSDILRPETKVYHIPNAISHRFFELGGAGDGHTVLFMGRVIRRKRVLDLVQAFAKLVQRVPRAQLRVAGECRSDPDYVASVRTCILQAGLSDCVHLLGSLPESEVLEEYARCDVFALPSIQETAPMVIAQAMAAGKPVVASAVGGVPEMVCDGQDGYLHKVGDVGSIADALQCLLRDPGLRARMGEKGKETAEVKYRAATVAERTYQVYQSIVGRR